MVPWAALNIWSVIISLPEPLAWILPSTCNFSLGLSVPIPTLLLRLLPWPTIFNPDESCVPESANVLIDILLV